MSDNPYQSPQSDLTPPDLRERQPTFKAWMLHWPHLLVAGIVVAGLVVGGIWPPLAPTAFKIIAFTAILILWQKWRDKKNSPQ